MRTDVHSEKALKPENYEVIEYIYTNAPPFMGSGEGYAAIMKEFRADMERIQKMLRERGAMLHGGWSSCDHCGAYYHHGVVLEPRPTKELITVGWICAEERFNISDLAWKRKRMEKVMKQIRHRRGRFAKLRTFAKENREAVRLLNKHRDNSFLGSLRDQLIARATLSERQLECIPKAAERQAKWTAEKAKQDAEPKKPAPEGRVEIEGEIVHVKLQESHYGDTLKMLVKCDGFRVWSTVPSSLEGEVKGRRVKFTATLTRSDKDESFAFAKRPVKAEFTAEAA